MSRDNPIRDHAGEFAAAVGVVILVVILWWVFIASLRDIDSKGPGRGLTRAELKAERNVTDQTEAGTKRNARFREEMDALDAKRQRESQAKRDESSRLLREMPLTPQALKAVKEYEMTPEELAKLSAGPTGRITIVEVEKLLDELGGNTPPAKVDATSGVGAAAASKDDPSAEAGRAATEAGLPARTGDAEPIVPGVPQLAPDATKTPEAANAAAAAQAASQPPSGATVGDQMLAPEASHDQAAAQAAEAPTFGPDRA